MEIVKTTKKVYKVLDITREPFMKFETFRMAREHIGLSVQRACFNCHKKFIDADNIYLAGTTGGNKLLCEECTKLAIKDLDLDSDSNRG